MRLIDADELKEQISVAISSMIEGNETEEELKLLVLIKATLNAAVMLAPTVKSEPVRHGHWICDEDAGWAQCSSCGYYYDISDDPPSKYCGGCGATMNERV